MFFDFAGKDEAFLTCIFKQRSWLFVMYNDTEYCYLKKAVLQNTIFKPSGDEEK